MFWEEIYHLYPKMILLKQVLKMRHRGAVTALSFRRLGITFWVSTGVLAFITLTLFFTFKMCDLGLVVFMNVLARSLSFSEPPRSPQLEFA